MPIRVYNMEIVMKPEFSTWHPNAQRRYVGFITKGATDYTEGNIDYEFRVLGVDARTYWGEVLLNVPERYRTLGGYYKDYSKNGAEWLKGAAFDAAREELKNSFSPEFRRLVQSIHVTKSR